MSRSSRKMHKKQAAKSKAEMSARNEALREKLKQQVEEEQYADGLATLAELIKDKSYDADTLYLGAYCYFMAGDYDRSAIWVDNTLSLDPGHVPTQILLSRLCILEDQTEKALAVLDNMLLHSRSQLTQEQQEELTDILEYYGREDPEHIEKDYPAICAFLKDELMDACFGGEAQSQSPAPQPVLAEEGIEGPASQAGGDALSVLQKLKSRLQPSLAEVETVEQGAAVQPQPAIDQNGTDIQAKLAEIAGKQVALTMKMHMYNDVAGRYFLQRDYQAAQAFLDAAAAIDPQDAETLRNLAMLAHEQGRRDEAVEYASKLPQVDFVLLAALR